MESVEGRLSRFLNEYDDATSDVVTSRAATIDTNLERWFEVLEDDPVVLKIIQELERRVDFQNWYEKETARNTGMGGDLRWPSGRENRIAMQILAFRAMQQEKPDLLNFHHEFMASSSNQLDTIVYDVTSQVFQPMARDLRKHIERVYDSEIGVEEFAIPASDRTVTIAHNSEDHAVVIEQLDQLEELISTANDFSNVEERDQCAAETSATRRLLNSARVRVDALISLCYRGLLYIAKKYADVAIGLIAASTLALIGKLTGLW